MGPNCLQPNLSIIYKRQDLDQGTLLFSTEGLLFFVAALRCEEMSNKSF